MPFNGFPISVVTRASNGAPINSTQFDDNLTTIRDAANNLDDRLTTVEGDYAKIDMTNVNDSTLLDKIKNVDGSGSGLDADTLDGEDSSAYYKKSEIIGAVGNISSPLLYLPLKNSLAMVQGTGSVTFTRASTATYVDRYGIVKSAAIDEPRFEKEGLLIEGSSTNKLLYSEDFSNAAWQKLGTTITANDTTAPDNQLIATRLAEDTTTGIHKIYQSSASVIPGSTYTGSIFVKSKERNSIYMSIYDGTTTVGRAYFDLSNGAGTLGDLGDNISIEYIGNGWYRCALSATTTSSATYIALHIHITETYQGAYSYTGDGTSGLYIWGAQLEELPFASSYIPTTDSTITRAADVCYFTYDNNCPNIQNLDAVTYSLKFDAFGDMGDIDHYLLAGDNVNNRHILSMGYDLGHFIVMKNNKGFHVATTVSPHTTYLTTGIFNNRFKLYVNGSFVGQDLTGIDIASYTLPTNLYLGSRGEFQGGFNGHISEVRIWDFALTDLEASLL